MRNFRNLGLALLIAFLAISVWSEVRPRATHGGYGSLLERVLPDVEQKPVEAEVVPEEPAPPPETEPPPAPMEIVEPNGARAARPFWQLEDDAQIGVPQDLSSARQGDSKVTIVGGPEGVTIVRTQRRKPVLSGGFGR